MRLHKQNVVIWSDGCLWLVGNRAHNGHTTKITFFEVGFFIYIFLAQFINVLLHK